MERDERVTQFGQGPEMTVSSFGRGRFTVPKGQRHRMAKPVYGRAITQPIADAKSGGRGLADLCGTNRSTGQLAPFRNPLASLASSGLQCEVAAGPKLTVQSWISATGVGGRWNSQLKKATTRSRWTMGPTMTVSTRQRD